MSRQWRWPLALGGLTVVGLLAALVGGGGVWWPLSWGALAAPLAVAAWHIGSPLSRRAPPPSHGR